MSCTPDKPAKDETLHWLSCRGGTEKQFLWRNGAWNTPGTNYGTKPTGMATLGWRYARPVETATTDQSKTGDGNMTNIFSYAILAVLMGTAPAAARNFGDKHFPTSPEQIFPVDARKCRGDIKPYACVAFSGSEGGSDSSGGSAGDSGSGSGGGGGCGGGSK